MEKVPDKLAGASVFCLPSHVEPFGIAVLEAFSCRLPVVVTKVGGLTTYVRHGENGSIVAPGHPEELANALYDLLSDPEKCRRFGEAGFHSIQETGTWDAVGERIRATISQRLTAS